MKINVTTDISDEYNNINITIKAPEMTEEVQRILDNVLDLKNGLSEIVAYKDNKIFFITIKDVMCFYSEDKYNYLRTKDGTYRVKYKLFELEGMLSKTEFVRISNSCIINIKQVECFDTSFIGTILVKFKDGTEENVSRRRVSEIMKLLKGGN